MDFLELVKKCRSYRRYDESHAIDTETVRYLVDCARLTASGANMQPLKYVGTCTPASNAAVFETLAWAGSLPDWPGPSEGERPTAYIVICTDTTVRESADADLGIAAQTIVLAAAERGLGGCMFGSVQRSKLRETLGLAEHLTISLVVALGKPVEVVQLEESTPGGSTTYYRDEKAVHHVPKRGMDEVLLEVR
jgi:nitroreductase